MKNRQNDSTPILPTLEMQKFLKRQKIFFGLPMYGGMCSQNMFQGFCDYINIAARLGMVWYTGQLTNESLIPRARNAIVAEFLSTDATHLMFIDSDIGFKPESIFKLLLDNLDVVGGLYPKKTLPVSYAVNKKPDGKNFGDFIEVDNVGTGFMLIKRQVIEKMIKNHPELKVNVSSDFYCKREKYMYALFDTLIDENGDYLSEDYTFCYRWRKMGGSVYADASIQLTHSGHYIFQGNQSQISVDKR